MKRLYALLLIGCFVIGASFKVQDDDDKYKPAFTATLDGNTFQLQPEQLFRGLLVDKAASIDGKIPARTVINSTFAGPSYTGADSRQFTEGIQFEMKYDGNSKAGPVSDYSVSVQYQNATYYPLKDQSKITITALVWEYDKKHFILCADFNCKMRSMAYPNDGKKDIVLKGKMTNIRITVPSWLATKI